MAAALRQRIADLDQAVRGSTIGVARIIVGLMWLANLHWKIPPDFGESSGGGLYKYSASVTRNSPSAPFTWLTENVVLPNFVVFGWFTLLAEMVIATLLLVGYRSRLAAIAGAALSVPILLSVIYYDRADEWSWSYLLMIAAHLLLYATDSGASLGLDGALERRGTALARSIRFAGIGAVALGAVGLYVSRNLDFAGREMALVGSDAGFVNDAGDLVRRWELKFVWFNPLTALATIGLGVVALVSQRLSRLTMVSGVGFALLAVVILVIGDVSYVRDDASVQTVGTSANAAVWFGFSVVLLAAGRAAHRDRPTSPR